MTYEHEEVVLKYDQHKELQPAEQVILRKFKDEINHSHLLDIGIGAGRTTLHLIPACRHYTGVDYSQKMVEFCKKKFTADNALFEVCDARDMDLFHDGQFDTVIFSFNGIDSVSKQDRRLILDEVRRVGKPNGLFIFSCHNIRKLDNLFSYRFTWNPLEAVLELRRYLRFRSLNDKKAEYEGKDWIILRDGADDFRSEFVYVKPELQVKELEELGFSDIELYSNKTGEIVPLDDIENYKNAWIYFSCRI